MRRSVLLLAVARVAAQSCPPKVSTACGPGQTCCPTFESLSGYGCCGFPGAVCCAPSPTTQGCCPPNHKCVTEGYATTCVPAGGGANGTGFHVCPPGAAHPPPPAGGLPSVITIGDSVSEGYEPVLAANLSVRALVQHSPFSDGGGADDVFHGLDCQENFLRTALYQSANWSVITFNFGLHDLVNTTANYAAYESALTNFTRRLQLTSSKLLYISTTPMMELQYYGNNAPIDLNTIAQRVMAAAGVPYADLYSHITAYCGERYSSCSLCYYEPWPQKDAPPGAHCGYQCVLGPALLPRPSPIPVKSPESLRRPRALTLPLRHRSYTQEGYEYIVAFLAPLVAALL